MATQMTRKTPDIICYANRRAPQMATPETTQTETPTGVQKMATKTNRRRPDPLTQRDGYADPVAEGIHYSIKPLDRLAVEMELKWGCDRLAGLVSPATAARFGSAKAKLDAAIESNRPVEVAHAAAVLLRGWSALDAEAVAGGHTPLEPTVWPHTAPGGLRVAIVQGNAEAIKTARTNPAMRGVKIYSLDEIGLILEADSNALVNATKHFFPGARVASIKNKNPGDDAPW